MRSFSCTKEIAYRYCRCSPYRKRSLVNFIVSAISATIASSEYATRRFLSRKSRRDLVRPKVPLPSLPNYGLWTQRDSFGTSLPGKPVQSRRGEEVMRVKWSYLRRMSNGRVRAAGSEQFVVVRTNQGPLGSSSRTAGHVIQFPCSAVPIPGLDAAVLAHPVGRGTRIEIIFEMSLRCRRGRRCSRNVRA